MVVPETAAALPSDSFGDAAGMRHGIAPSWTSTPRSSACDRGSDLTGAPNGGGVDSPYPRGKRYFFLPFFAWAFLTAFLAGAFLGAFLNGAFLAAFFAGDFLAGAFLVAFFTGAFLAAAFRSEEHTSELQSLRH